MTNLDISDEILGKLYIHNLTCQHCHNPYIYYSSMPVNDASNENLKLCFNCLQEKQK